MKNDSVIVHLKGDLSPCTLVQFCGQTESIQKPFFVTFTQAANIRLKFRTEK